MFLRLTLLTAIVLGAFTTNVSAAPLSKFKDLAEVLITIHPGRDNKNEWANVRNSIVQSSDQDNATRLKALVNVLKQQHPTRDNKAEWAAIRTTSTEILKEWDSRPKKRPLFRKLLLRFLATIPGRSNKAEWSRIRAISQSILN